MHNSVKELLSNLVEDQVTSLIREASCVQRHVKRARYQHPQTPSNRNPSEVSNNLLKRIDAADINLALQWRGCQSLFTTNTGAPFAATSSEESDPAKHVKATDRGSTRVNLNSYIRSEMQSHPPSEIAMSLHWLAVDGVQPSIPQNPLLPHHYTRSQAHTDPPNLNVDADAAQDTVDNDDLGTVDRVVHRVEDDDEYGIGVSIRQLLPRLLPDELKYYFTNVAMKMANVRENSTITNAQIMEEEQDEALASLSTDRGIQELVPFFSQFVNNQIRFNLKKVDHCRTMIRMMDSLVKNPNLTLEMHLNQMIVPIITCTVARQLGTHRNENHWTLREEAAQLLVKIHKKYGAQYTNLSPRILEVLCEAIEPDKPMTTQYGGILGLSLFGTKTIDAFLLPIAIQYWTQWEGAIQKLVAVQDNIIRSDQIDNADEGEREVKKENEKTQEEKLIEAEEAAMMRLEIQRCQQALLNALGIHIHQSSQNGNFMDWDTSQFQDAFGEQWIPLQTSQQNQSDYLMCLL